MESAAALEEVPDLCAADDQPVNAQHADETFQHDVTPFLMRGADLCSVGRVLVVVLDNFRATENQPVAGQHEGQGSEHGGSPFIAPGARQGAPLVSI